MLNRFNPCSPCGGATIGPSSSDYSGRNFNPRSPYGERRVPCLSSRSRSTFQSTLPMRGATLGALISYPYSSNFNPRSPCGERLKIPKIDSRGIHFNPRSPCGERHYQLLFSVQPFAFQSTLPMRGATHSKNSGINSAYSHFNPRSPCGERRLRQ